MTFSIGTKEDYQETPHLIVLVVILMLKENRLDPVGIYLGYFKTRY